MEDDRAATAPIAQSGRYRLRTHELAPVIQPRSRAASSSPVSTNREVNAVPPSLPRGSIARVSSPHRGRAVLESIAFDPFSDSKSFNLLLQDPEDSSERRKDPKAVAEFRHWHSHHFPQLLRTFRVLCMIHAEQKEEDPSDAVVQEPTPNGIDDTEKIGSTEAEQEAADSEEAWRLIFGHATVMSVTPGETIAIESITRTERVYFLLNGHCQLSFRPRLLPDNKTRSTPSTMPRIRTGVHGFSEVIHLRELVAGDCFGLDAAAFGFEYSLSTATADSARQRNFLGLREVALTYVLCLPYVVVRQLQHRHQDSNVRLPPTFPFSFAPEAEVFLRNTFLFRAMADSSRRFLAAHMSPVIIAQQEYLFTPGQPVRAFIVISGQLTLGSPREDHHGGRTEADLELELLQAHDSVGLAETLHLETSFDRYCAVTSVNGARAYALPSTVLLMVLAQESSTLELIQEWIAHRKAWYELRRATALAQRKRLTAEGPEHVVRLTLAAQRRSKLTCSRCGWTGHVSTSSSCVCVDISVSESPALPMLQLDKRSRAAREQARRSQRLRSTEISESDDITPTQQQQFPFSISPVSPTNSRRTPAHRRLQVDSIVLRGLQISRVSIVEHLQPGMPTSQETETQEEQHTNVKATSSKEDALRSCALTQSLRRLEVALQNKQTSPVQQNRR